MGRWNWILVGLSLICLLTTGLFGQTEATDASGGSISETVVDTLTLLFLLFGAYIAWELYSIMKGGELARSWGWLSGASIIFGVVKIIEIAGRAGYFPVPRIVLSVGYFFVAFFLFLGFMRQRKMLG
ncbi:hypothetical protein J7L01_04120 [bacterium]|nr:hypothetical protein [bacterium]